MKQYIISPLATRDLNAIVDYFLERNVEAGENLLREFDVIENKIEILRVVNGRQDLESLFAD